mmetsp:Transcript_20848/g.49477  ORF Transcript_20848/g.49477 Transcript_20848/m.49477 type:complete len:280 (-) Transcript_20848:1930-2769(-)
MEEGPEASDADDWRGEAADHLVPGGSPLAEVGVFGVHQLPAQRRGCSRHLDPRGARAAAGAAQRGVGRRPRPWRGCQDALRVLLQPGAAALACGPVHGPLPPSFPALLRGEPGALLVHYGALAGRVVRAEQDHHRAKDPRGGDLGLQEDELGPHAAVHPRLPGREGSVPPAFHHAAPGVPRHVLGQDFHGFRPELAPAEGPVEAAGGEPDRGKASGRCYRQANGPGGEEDPGVRGPATDHRRHAALRGAKGGGGAVGRRHANRAGEELRGEGADREGAL